MTALFPADPHMAVLTGRRVRYPVGEAAWVGLISYVVLYDLIASRKQIPTLSACFASYLARRPHRIALLAAWGVLTTHLFWDILSVERGVQVLRLEWEERHRVAQKGCEEKGMKYWQG